LKNSILSMWAL